MKSNNNLIPENRQRALLSRITHDDSGCWLWHGRTLGNGYGAMRVDGKVRYAHRISYELFVDLIPDGMQIDHTCHNRTDCAGGSSCVHRRCVNPDHLEPVTNRENGQRSPNNRARKTHCKHGHEFTPENTYRNARGHRTCRTCHQESRVRLFVPKGRGRPTHCPQGHEFSPENTRPDRGGRKCRECGRVRWRRWYAEGGSDQVRDRKRRQRERRTSGSIPSDAEAPPAGRVRPLL